jgi:hypothetical protein
MTPAVSTARIERRTDMPAALSPLSNHTSAEHTVMIRLTIEADGVSRVRQAVTAACGGSVQFMPPQRIPRSTQVWVWLVLVESSVSAAMGATLRAVPYGEIGRVFRQAQNPPKTGREETGTPQADVLVPVGSAGLAAIAATTLGAQLPTAPRTFTSNANVRAG